MTKKPNKYARKAATQIEVGKQTIRTSPYLGKSESDHIRFMAQTLGCKKDDPNFLSVEYFRKEYLELLKKYGYRSAQAAVMRAKGIL